VGTLEASTATKTASAAIIITRTRKRTRTGARLKRECAKNASTRTIRQKTPSGDLAATSIILSHCRFKEAALRKVRRPELLSFQ